MSAETEQHLFLSRIMSGDVFSVDLAGSIGFLTVLDI